MASVELELPVDHVAAAAVEMWDWSSGELKAGQVGLRVTDTRVRAC